MNKHSKRFHYLHLFPIILFLSAFITLVYQHADQIFTGILTVYAQAPTPILADKFNDASIPDVLAATSGAPYQDIGTDVFMSGNLGIGSTAPLGPLSVGNASVDGSNGNIVIGKRAGASTRQYKIGFDNSFNFVIGDYGASNVAGTWTSPFAIAWNAPSSSLHISGTGYVGIGTVSPSQKLQISGGGAYNLGVVCGNSQCLHFNNNGWIYTGDTAGSVYGGVGLAAAQLYSAGKIYLRGVDIDSNDNGVVNTAENAWNADTTDGYHLNQDVRTTGAPTFRTVATNQNVVNTCASDGSTLGADGLQPRCGADFTIGGGLGANLVLAAGMYGGGNLIAANGIQGGETTTGWRLGRGNGGPDAWLRLSTPAAPFNYHALAVGAFWANGLTRFDLAEITPAREEDSLEQGDVVVIDPDQGTQVKKSNKPYDMKVYGIVSSYDQAAMVIGGDVDPGKASQVKDKTPVALIGRVQAKVSAENGAIEVGDLLTTSSTPGYLMKCTDKINCIGAIAGKALEKVPEGKQKILVLVTLQ